MESTPEALADARPAPRRKQGMWGGGRRVALAWGVGMATGWAQPVTAPIATTPGSRVTIDAVNVYGAAVPARGYLPVRVTIKNGSEGEGVWTVNSQAMDDQGQFTTIYTTEIKATVPGRAARTVELLAPLPSTPSPYRQVRLLVSGPGTDGKSGASWWANPSRGGVNLYVGLSPALFQNYGNKLQDFYENRVGRSYQQAKLDPALLSQDWRAYLGLDAMIYTASEWIDVPADARAAILQWVALGGELRLLAVQVNGMGLPPRQGYHYQAGRIWVFAESAAEDFDFNYNRGGPRLAPKPRPLESELSVFNFQYEPPPEMEPLLIARPAQAVDVGAAYVAPALDRNFSFAAVVIVAFGVVIGPVNLFVFCRGARRPRLLWMTPLLSVAASLILMGFILLADGIGGSGIYYRLTQLAPDGKYAVETQVSSSVTGLVIKSSFSLAKPAWMQAYLSPDSSHPAAGGYNVVGTEYSGDWIRSRSAQTQMMQAVFPSRGALRIAVPKTPAGPGGGGPTLHSDYNALLQDVYYIDGAGKAWKTARVASGQEVRLEPSSLEAVAVAWTVNVGMAPQLMKDYFRHLAPQPGMFFALGPPDEAGMLPMVSGMQWKNVRHVVVGTVE